MFAGRIQVLHQARLPDGSMVDLQVDSGIVTKVTSCIGAACAAASSTAVDLDGRLVLPAPAEPHAHLDKALLAGRLPYQGGDLAASIAQMQQAYDSLDADDLYDRARRAAREAVRNGCTVIRSHADTGDRIGTRAVEALLALREELRGVVDVRVTALLNPQVTGAAGRRNRQDAERAITLGVDALGGCPALDTSPTGAVRWYVATAADARLPLDLHVDEDLDPSARSLALLACEVLETGFPLAVSASHCVSLGVHDHRERRQTIELVRQAGIGVVACPQTNLLLQGRSEVPGARGIAPVAALRHAGVVTAGGGDNWRDPFNPLGRIDPLETAALLVSGAHLTPRDAYEAVSVNARTVTGVPAAGPEVGAVADLLAVRARDVEDLVAGAPADRLVVRAGHVVARTEVSAWTALDVDEAPRTA